MSKVQASFTSICGAAPSFFWRVAYLALSSPFRRLEASALPSPAAFLYHLRAKRGSDFNPQI